MSENDLRKRISKMDSFDYAMIALAIIAFLLYLKYSPHCFWIDEARDMFITRGFLRTGQLTYFNETYMQHPFGFFLLIAASSLFFGMTDTAGRIVVIFAGTGTVIFTYLLGKELFNKLTGLIAAILLAFHPLFWFLTDRILNDVPMTFFITSGLYFFVRSEKRKEARSLYFSSFLFAFALLTKISSIVILPSLLVYLYYKQEFKWVKDKRYWYALLILFLTFSTWMIRNQISVGYAFPFDDYFGRLKPGEHNLDVQPFSYYIKNYNSTFRIYPLLLFLFGVLAAALRKFKDAELILIWTIFFFILMSMQTVKVPRYMTPIFPTMFIIAGYGFSKLLKDFRKQKPLIYALIILIVGATTYVSYAEAVILIPSAAQGFCGLKETGEFLAVNTQPDDVIMAASNTQIHWYSDRWVVSFPSDVTTFDSYVEENSVDYIVVDLWERTAPPYIMNNGQLWNPYFLNNEKYELIWAYSLFENNYVTFVYEVKE